jgi:hypothetical protein
MTRFPFCFYKSVILFVQSIFFSSLFYFVFFFVSFNFNSVFSYLISTSSFCCIFIFLEYFLFILLYVLSIYFSLHILSFAWFSNCKSHSFKGSRFTFSLQCPHQFTLSVFLSISAAIHWATDPIHVTPLSLTETEPPPQSSFPYNSQLSFPRGLVSLAPFMPFRC